MDCKLLSLLLCVLYYTSADIRNDICNDVSFKVTQGRSAPGVVSTKPMTVYSGSPCYGMEGTCCHPRAERLLMPTTELEYHDKLQEYLRNNLAICRSFGRKLSGALFNNIKESRTIFEVEMSGLLGTNIPAEMFDSIFTYLYQFTYERDFCQLQSITENQMRKLVKHIFQKENILTPDCTNLEQEYIELWMNNSMQQMIEILNKVRLLSETSDLVKGLINQTQQHKFHHSCRKAIFTIKDCAKCIGYSHVTPCDGNCLNVFKGCMSELADTTLHLQNLALRYKSIATVVSNQFEPITFVRNGLIMFIQLVRHLRRSNLTELATSGCSLQNQSTMVLQSIVGNNTLQYYKANKKFEEPIIKAVEHDENCFNSMISKFVAAAEGVCDIEPNHLSYIRNYQCWNGTAEAEYNEDIVGPFSADQGTNPAYDSDQLPTSNQYQLKIDQINNVTQEINHAINYLSCRNTDDEDCSTQFIINCEIVPPQPEYSGSGASGWGSGELYDSALSEPISFVVGSPRQFNDGNDIYEEKPTKDITNIPTTEDSNTDVKSEYNMSMNDTIVITATATSSIETLKSSSQESNIVYSNLAPKTSVIFPKATNNYYVTKGSGFSVHAIGFFILFLPFVITYFIY